MGVHDLDKYDEVRSALGIPEGEPLFILRGQDITAVDVVLAYRRNYTQSMLIAGKIPDKKFVDDLDNVAHEFLAWRQDHHDTVKLPD